jgi:hypothetical protein
LVGANAARMLGIPGAMYLTAFASMIFLYAPVSLLIGWFAARVPSFLRTRHSFVRLASVPTLTAISLLGFALTAGVSSSAYNLVEPADLRAMAWIRANVPREARFLVNGFTIYDGSTIVGSDAGWWIPLLTERVSTMPPQYALLTEEEVEPGYGQRMVGLVSALRHHSVSSPEGLALLCSEGITHVYIGQGEGRVAVPPSEPLFTAGEMLASPAFQELYHRDKVWILALNRSVCAGHSG